jgi:hypothetical protein
MCEIYEQKEEDQSNTDGSPTGKMFLKIPELDQANIFYELEKSQSQITTSDLIKDPVSIQRSSTFSQNSEEPIQINDQATYFQVTDLNSHQEISNNQLLESRNNDCPNDGNLTESVETRQKNFFGDNRLIALSPRFSVMQITFTPDKILEQKTDIETSELNGVNIMIPSNRQNDYSQVRKENKEPPIQSPNSYLADHSHPIPSLQNRSQVCSRNKRDYQLANKSPSITNGKFIKRTKVTDYETHIRPLLTNYQQGHLVVNTAFRKKLSANPSTLSLSRSILQTRVLTDKKKMNDFDMNIPEIRNPQPDSSQNRKDGKFEQSNNFSTAFSQFLHYLKNKASYTKSNNQPKIHTSPKAQQIDLIGLIKSNDTRTARISNRQTNKANDHKSRSIEANRPNNRTTLDPRMCRLFGNTNDRRSLSAKIITDNRINLINISIFPEKSQVGLSVVETESQANIYSNLIECIHDNRLASTRLSVGNFNCHSPFRINPRTNNSSEHKTSTNVQFFKEKISTNHSKV